MPTIPGLEVAIIADLDPERAKAACRAVGWDEERIKRTRFTDDGSEACQDGAIDAVIEATGNPAAGIAHALAAIEAKKQAELDRERQREIDEAAARAKAAEAKYQELLKQKMQQPQTRQ